MPAVFINHGGGPLPLLGRQPEVASFLSRYPSTIFAKPRAVIVVTAHWEATLTKVSTAARYPLYFDYGGFPKESYEYEYPAPGEPALAARALELLRAASVPCEADEKRPWDHGVFVPMMLMFPEADVPLVQVSLCAHQDAADHLAVGQALSPILDEGVLIVGSGASFHNFKYFFGDDKVKAEGRRHSVNFDRWLRGVMTDPALSADERAQALVRWQEAPSALEAHPRGASEHLTPLFVVAGAGMERGPARPVGDAAEGEGGSAEQLGRWEALGRFAVSQFEFA